MNPIFLCQAFAHMDLSPFCAGTLLVNEAHCLIFETLQLQTHAATVTLGDDRSTVGVAKVLPS